MVHLILIKYAQPGNKHGHSSFVRIEALTTEGRRDVRRTRYIEELAMGREFDMEKWSA